MSSFIANFSNNFSILFEISACSKLHRMVHSSNSVIRNGEWNKQPVDICWTIVTLLPNKNSVGNSKNKIVKNFHNIFFRSTKQWFLGNQLNSIAFFRMALGTTCIFCYKVKPIYIMVNGRKFWVVSGYWSFLQKGKRKKRICYVCVAYRYLLL